MLFVPGRLKWMMYTEVKSNPAVLDSPAAIEGSQGRVQDGVDGESQVDAWPS